ncbi:hypothetical protein JK364_07190 [Streptomyces sp. 110]|uniref:Resolvase/invertase-type recombinase catalytic domain-containing protein n=1 Tax=Streptomyces endocoffeicus TaxID=2898945 RepID=A0ABS1PIL3_9ACTN|nr:hypothetical protein [Streptomyces endocoffeicus]MBL1112193.1 hypothetical protein [Streptomyces endocoffeicus]
MEGNATESTTLAFIYDREATRQTDRLGARIALCREYAARLGWSVAGQWVDRGDAAVAERRPFWIGMVAAMKHEGQGFNTVCLVASWERIAYDERDRAQMRRLVSDVDGTCVAIDGSSVSPSSRDATLRRLRASGEQVGPGVTLVRHDVL